MGGVDLLVEVAPVVGSEPTSAKLDRAHEAVVGVVDQLQTTIEAVAESTVRTISHLAERTTHPDEMEVKFGLKFTAQGNVVVAGAAGEASLEVTMTYRRDLGGVGDGGD
jgi:NTP-dependent ternary system trypsin peptidase co-occuring protein